MDHRLNDVQRAAVAAMLWCEFAETEGIEKDIDYYVGYWLCKVDEILDSPEISQPELEAMTSADV